LTPEKRILYL
jgi:hypothetical protein